ncbi:MAG: hypothetical protein SPJ13_00905 [Bacteroidales bacterium]|nr:hypothetical protein [Bacteroidales bacterium]
MAEVKDWTGNTNSVYKTIAASNHAEGERQCDDYYATDPVAIEKLLQVYDVPHHVWECACGAGHLSKALIESGREVVSTDIKDRGYGYVGIDFLKEPLPECLADEGNVCILTNPPYKFATEFIEHSLAVLPQGQPCVMLLKTTALEGKGRWERLYRHGWLQAVYQFKERLMCAKNGDFGCVNGSAVSYGWFVFSKVPNQRASIEWI